MSDSMDRSFMSAIPTEYWMFRYKVEPCTRTDMHDWEKCPYSHVGDKSRRRPPHLYESKHCPYTRSKKVCPAWDACPMAHTLFEYWLHPDRFRTCFCSKGDACDRPMCFFAHNATELRHTPLEPPSPPTTPPSSTPPAVSGSRPAGALASVPSGVSVSPGSSLAAAVGRSAASTPPLSQGDGSYPVDMEALQQMLATMSSGGEAGLGCSPPGVGGQWRGGGGGRGPAMVMAASAAQAMAPLTAAAGLGAAAMQPMMGSSPGGLGHPMMQQQQQRPLMGQAAGAGGPPGVGMMGYGAPGGMSGAAAGLVAPQVLLPNHMLPLQQVGVSSHTGVLSLSAWDLREGQPMSTTPPQGAGGPALPHQYPQQLQQQPLVDFAQGLRQPVGAAGGGAGAMGGRLSPPTLGPGGVGGTRGTRGSPGWGDWEDATDVGMDLPQGTLLYEHLIGNVGAAEVGGGLLRSPMASPLRLPTAPSPPPVTVLAPVSPASSAQVTPAVSPRVLAQGSDLGTASQAGSEDVIGSHRHPGVQQAASAPPSLCVSRTPSGSSGVAGVALADAAAAVLDSMGGFNSLRLDDSDQQQQQRQRQQQQQVLDSMGGFNSLRLDDSDQQQQQRQQQQQVLGHLAAADGLMAAAGGGVGSASHNSTSMQLAAQAPGQARVSHALKLLLTSLTLEELEEVHTQLDGWLSLLRNTNNAAAAAAAAAGGLGGL